MGLLEIILIVFCVAVVVSVIVTSIIRKKKGKTSCGCDSSSCSYCSSCNSHKKADK